MTTGRQPTRWADAAADAPDGAAATIAALRQLRGGDAQLRALSERLGPQLAAPTVSGTAAWTAMRLGAVGKAAGVVVLSALLLGLYLAARQGASSATTTPAITPPRAPAHAGEAVAPAGPVPPLSAPLPPQAPAPAPALPQASSTSATTSPPAARRPQARAQRQPAAAPAAAPSAPEAELALLKRSQAALDRDAAHALALAEQHAREHPGGVFVQEREMLAIEALMKLRRRAAALQRAERFADRFPRSPHAVRVRALLEGPADP